MDVRSMDVERLRRDAEAEIAGAQYNFGVWHLFGESGRKYAEQARKWFREHSVPKK